MKNKSAENATTISLPDMLQAIKRADKQPSPEGNGFEADADFITNSLRAEFVAQVRAVMKERGIKNGAELARRSGLSRERISKILQEKGNIELRTIARIATALEAPVAVRVGRENMKAVVSSQPQRAKTLVVHVTSNEYFPEFETVSEKNDFRPVGRWVTSIDFPSLTCGKQGS